LVVAAVVLTVISAAVGGLTASVVHPLDLGLGDSTAHGRGATPLGESVQRVAVRVLPSVVKLETMVGGFSTEGSGIILSSEGLIMTNDHVVTVPVAFHSGFGEVTTLVTLADGRTTPFTVVAGDPITDIAVVRAQHLSGLVPIELGSSNDLQIGQNVVAVGAPLGMEGTVTRGIISALDRPISSTGDTAGDSTVLDAIQTDAAINPGNSGGALVDMSGRLIGVNAATATTGGDYVNGPGGSIGLGFAIPVDQAIRTSNQLVTTGKATHATLGIEVASDPPRRGAKVVGVDPNGPGAAVGLPAGALITKIDGRVVVTADDVVATLRAKDPGDALTLTYTDPSGIVETRQVTLGSD
jgi:putative serine protease PepD